VSHLTAYWCGEYSMMLYSAQGEELRAIALAGLTRNCRAAVTECPSVLPLALDPLRDIKPEVFALLPADVQAMASK